MDEYHDVVVVGAGVAGAAAATTLARQGYQVLVLERSLKEPDRIVGELLQPGGVAALEDLGLGSAVNDIDAIPVKGYHIYWKDEEVTFYYPPLDRSHDVSRPPAASVDEKPGNKGSQRPEGRNFHHGRFVSQLRDIAKTEDRVTLLECTVTNLVTDKQTGRVIGVECLNKTAESSTYYANLVIVADGASSNLRAQLHEQKPMSKSRFWGLELHDVELPYHGLAYGLIGRGPPILVYQIGSRETRILIDIPNPVHDIAVTNGCSIRTYIEETVVPTLPQSVGMGVMSALKSGRLRSMPNEWLPGQITKIPGVLVLGDAGNIRHPLTGSGMTVALCDIVLLRDLLNPKDVSLQDTIAVHKRLRTFHRKRKAHSTSLNILAQALYTLFVADDPHLEIMQRGFVRYIQFGGKYVEEPSGLMGGVYSNPVLLFRHFFAIALWSMWLLIRESPVWMLPVSLVKCGQVFFRAVSLILPFIYSEL